MAIVLRKSTVLASLAISLSLTGVARAATYTAEDALTKLEPVQKDAQVDRPTGAEIAKCTIKPEKSNGNTGWVVRDGAGQILRNFMDTNGDGTVDQWSYFKDGIEVYRDIDSNFNKKADQYRWLNTAGTRWGIDTDENGKIDFWKTISAEEVTAELVAAIRDRDRPRFERLLLTGKELKTLGLGDAKAEQLTKMIETASPNFAKLASQQTLVKADTKWVSSSGGQPGLVPTGTEDSTADLLVYENVAAMIETDNKPQAITIGTLVRVKDVWRLVDAPQIPDDPTAAVEPKTFFFAVPRSERPDAQIGKTNEKTQAILSELNALSEQDFARRATLLEQLAEESDAEMRTNCYRQMADTLSSAVQTGANDEDIEKQKALLEKQQALLEKLQALLAKLKAEPKDEDLATYVQFRCMMAEHGKALAMPDVNFAVVQAKWITDLKSFVESAKKSPDLADAYMELAIAAEFGGDEEDAIKFYGVVAKDYPQAPFQPTAKGAVSRLTSVGKSIPLVGKTLDNKKFDLAELKGKVVLVQYWATWCGDPYKAADLPLLIQLHRKYAKRGFEIVGVSLDEDRQKTVAFLQENEPTWPQLWETGGLTSRYATQLGIQTLPMMLLIDKQGKVVNRNIRAQQIEADLKSLLK